MRVLVCGGRDFGEAADDATPEEFELALKQGAFIHNILWQKLGSQFWEPSQDVIITGGARGVDTIANHWANKIAGCQTEVYPAKWKQYGKKAGYIRNKQMLEEGKPDVVIAFPGGKGTAMMVRLAREAGIPVEEIKYKPLSGQITEIV